MKKQKLRETWDIVKHIWMQRRQNVEKTINLEIIQRIATKVAHDIKYLECPYLGLKTLQDPLKHTHSQNQLHYLT